MIIDDGAGKDCSVGNRNENSVICGDDSAKQPEFANDSDAFVAFDLLAAAERSEKDEHDSGRHVGQRALQSQSDRKTGGTQDRDETRRLHTETLQHRDDGEDDDGVTHHRCGQRPKRGVETRYAAKAAAHPPRCPAGNRPARNENHDCGNEIDRIVYEQDLQLRRQRKARHGMGYAESYGSISS
jgi:hypothetical protein